MTDREEREQVLARLSNLLDVCPGQEIKLSFKDIMALEYAVNFLKKEFGMWKGAGMTDRENYLKELQVMHDWMQAANFILSSPERIKALDYAISSIKIDLKYDLLYENKPIITLDELKALKTEVDEIVLPEHIKSVDGSFAFCEALEYVDNILDKKISGLEDRENG